jgi:hypothetical protein
MLTEPGEAAHQGIDAAVGLPDVPSFDGPVAELREILLRPARKPLSDGSEKR